MQSSPVTFRVFLCIAAALLVSCADQVDHNPASILPLPTKVPQKQDSELSSVKAGAITVVRLDHLFGLKETDQVLLIDSRSALFYRMGHIDGAINLPTKKLDNVLPLIRPRLDDAVKADQIIVVYCQNEKCPYAHTVAKKLSVEGYHVSIYRGGWEEWKNAGF